MYLPRNIVLGYLTSAPSNNAGYHAQGLSVHAMQDYRHGSCLDRSLRKTRRYCAVSLFLSLRPVLLSAGYELMFNHQSLCPTHNVTGLSCLRPEAKTTVKPVREVQGIPVPCIRLRSKATSISVISGGTWQVCCRTACPTPACRLDRLPEVGFAKLNDHLIDQLTRHSPTYSPARP